MEVNTDYGVSDMNKNGSVLLYVPWEFDRLGGVDVVVDNLFSSLCSKGYDVAIAEQSWTKHGERFDQDSRRFININLMSLDFSHGLIKRLKVLLSFFWHTLKSYRLLTKHNVSVVNVHYPTKHVFSLAVLKKLRIWRGRLVLSFHGSDVDFVDRSDYAWTTILGVADRITTCSKSLQTKLSSVIPIDDIQVAYNGMDCEKIQALAVVEEKDSSFVVDGRYIICVANFVERKGQDILIKAFKAIEQELPDTNLVLVGGRDNGVWAGKLHDLCCELDIEDRVKFIFDVPHESIFGLIQRSSMMVLPSRYEPFGLVILEAGIVGTPVVASRVGGVEEIIDSDDLGRLYPVGDVRSLANEMLANFEDENESGRKSALLGKRVRENFSLSAMVSRYIAQY